ncbi:enoyl-CoA hydratase/isomerase family protein [Blastococcus saxobsidens]|uniref:Putative enoyl-CoA hydratase n=1 Tax=Blastococcus saxobsidens (strain DD2) TaxID=1146883 RepID=H6RSX8_BLASD|nr:enoyl-CoA hydratase/isomerase family protein [Blastococcus saxobsidens]CCG04281.1 putative enoyl-CoA hydratase [Blastococcus saxobsidens DD2]
MSEATPSYPNVSVSLGDDGTCEVVINRPDRLNALSVGVKDELVAALSYADRTDSVKSVVLTGAGERAFAAGQDLSEAQEFSPEAIDGWIDSFHRLYSAVLDCSKPTVAAVNGYAVGAGFQLALLCDLRIASSGAKFGMAEIDDAIPCITGTWTLYDSIGHSRTADLILTGRMLPAEEAKSWGLVSEVVAPEDLMTKGRALAVLLGAKPAVAVRLNKNRLAWLLSRERESAESFARQAHAEAYGTGLPQAKMADFLARRREGRSE